LSKGFLSGKENEASVLINPEAFYRAHGIGAHLNVRIDRIDLADNRLIGGCEEFRFQNLILATGASPRTLNVPGAQGGTVLYLRPLNDSARSLEEFKKVLVIGSGFIGTEVASQSAQQGCDTTMVFPEERVWKSFFTPEMSRFFQRYYEDRGVHFVPGAKVESIRGSTVELSNGKKLDADFVLAGIGVALLTEIVEAAGVHVQNGIVWNEFLESSAANVYAAGDVADY
jgi:NADPH-dependent 2,4-dienoyl-CoA reductase/sulfur reductase-like enzyme